MLGTILGSGLGIGARLISPAPVEAAAGTNWPKYGFDTSMTNASGETILSTFDAPTLAPLWSYTTGGIIVSSATVVGGVVYVGSYDGYEYALNASTGTLIWKTYLGVTTPNPVCYPTSAGISSTATVAGGIVYVGGGDSNWYALNASTGAVLWTVPTGDNSATGGHYNWSSPLIHGNSAYIGIASLGDCPLVPGQLLRVDLTTHAIVATADFVPSGEVGGGVWTSPSYDPVTNSVFVTTGTRNQPDQTLSEAFVALDPTTLAIKSYWQLPPPPGNSDADWGTSPILFSDNRGRSLVAAINKDGILYSLDRTNLAAGPVWTNVVGVSGICPTCGDGSVSNMAFANGVLYVAGGKTTINGTAYLGFLRAIDPATGNVIWQDGLAQTVVPALAYDNGMVFAGVGPNLEVFDAGSGAQLFSFPTMSSALWSPPTISGGIVYEGAFNGKVYAFAPPKYHGSPPGAPTNVSATAGDAMATVSWSAPGSSGDSPLSGYAVTANPGGQSCSTGATGTSCNVPGLTNGSPYTFTVKAQNSLGSSPASAPSNQVVPNSLNAATYYPLTPARILDTRDGTGGIGKLSSHVAQTFAVAGRGGVQAGAVAVTGNLTVTNQTYLGFLYVGPNPVNNPTSSTLNLPLGDDRANGVTVALGANGTLSVTYAAPVGGATADAVFDVTGYFMADKGGATYVPLTPARVLDTRNGTGGLGHLASHVAQTFTVAGHGGVPGNAIAVTGNLTVTDQTRLGYLFVGPVAADNPTSSTLNFPVGDDRPNGVDVALGPGGTLSVTYAAPSSGATADAIFDVTGYFVPGTSGALFFPLSPARVLDTRYGIGGIPTLSSHVAETFAVAGHGGVPSNALAVAGNLTVTAQTWFGFEYLGPNAINNPSSSTLNFPVGDDRANNATVALNGGNLSITFAAPVLGQTANAIFDVAGYFVP